MLALEIAPVLVEDYLPDDIQNLRLVVEKVFVQAPLSLIAQVAELRDYAENERYDEKEEVDDYLKTSPRVTEACREIQILYDEPDLVVAVSKYLELFKADMARLHHFHANALNCSRNYAASDWKVFWQKLVPFADRDNSHAMYLSSHNWPFSVFNRLTAEIELLIGPDNPSALANLLTAGIQDPRTFIYQHIGGTMLGVSRANHVSQIIKSEQYILGNGIMPLFAFEAAIKARRSGTPFKPAEEFQSRFNSEIATQLNNLNSSDSEHFLSIISLYKHLYTARAAYDIYEYFGCYAFLRHLLILKCAAAVGFKETADSQAFIRAAATYQFSKALAILDTMVLT